MDIKRAAEALLQPPLFQVTASQVRPMGLLDSDDY